MKSTNQQINKSSNDDCGKMKPVYSRWFSFPERDSGCLSLLLDIVCVNSLCPSFLYDFLLFWFVPFLSFFHAFSFFLSFSISLITFLSLYFSVNFFVFFSFHLFSLTLSFCFLSFHFCLYLFIDTVFVAEFLMLILVTLETVASKL